MTGQNPDGVDQSWNVAEQCQQDIEPELAAESDLEEDAERRDDHGEDDAKQISHGLAGDVNGSVVWHPE